MKISKISEDQYSEYSLLADEYGSIFNSLKWLELFGDKVSIFIFEDNDGTLQGGFFLYIQKKAGFKFLKTPPFTPTNGLFYVRKAANKSNLNSDEKRIMSALTDFLVSQRYAVLRISFPLYVTDFQPFIWSKYKVIPNYTYILDLNDTINEIYLSFSSEKRNEIKKAGKDIIEVFEEKDYKVILDSAEAVFASAGINYEQEILSKILLEFSDNTNSFSFIAKNKEEIHAFSFCLYDKRTAYYILGGSPAESRHNGAGSATLWECIKKAKSLGINSFDFEGSMNPGIEHYFRGFGGSLIPYFTVNKARLPIEIILKLVKREYF